MQNIQKKKWNVKAPKNFNNILNPIRNFVQRQIPVLNQKISSIQNRPQIPLNFSLGDPSKYKDYKPNPKILDILVQGVGKIDGYTNFQGDINSRKSLAQFYGKDSTEKISQDDIFLTFGGSLALWMSIAVLANPGDNFIFPKPCFPLSQTIGTHLGIEIRFCNLKKQSDWEVDIDALYKLKDERTRFLLVNNPSNPLGSVWSQKHKRQILKFCKDTNIPLVVDQIYERMTYKQSAPEFPNLRDGVTILKCSGLTKRWLVPGWRFGWVIVYGGDEANQIRRGLKNISNVLLMPHSIIQSKFRQIINQQSNQEYLKSRLKLLGMNQNYLKEHLKCKDYCNVTDANGALYTTINLNIQKFNIKNTMEFISQLYLEQNIMVLPGQFFFSQNFLRVVICSQLKLIEEFVLRFIRFCEKHLKGNKDKIEQNGIKQ